MRDCVDQFSLVWIAVSLFHRIAIIDKKSKRIAQLVKNKPMASSAGIVRPGASNQAGMFNRTSRAILLAFAKKERMSAGKRNAYGPRWPRERIRATKHHTVSPKKKSVNKQKSDKIPCIFATVRSPHEVVVVNTQLSRNQAGSHLANRIEYYHY
jgi:hypothetical protein